jgi:hypothetical protein
MCVIAGEDIGPRDIVTDLHLGRWSNMKAWATLAVAYFPALPAVFKVCTKLKEKHSDCIEAVKNGN